MDLELVKTRRRETATQCIVQRSANLLQEQAKKTVALTVFARRIEKTAEYARQIGFLRTEIVEYGKLRRGSPIQFRLRPLGNVDRRAETSKKDRQFTPCEL